VSIYNYKKTLFYKLKSSCKKEWSEYTNHKFLSDLVNNKLPYKNFKNYLIQDYVFLQQFLKILALSVYKSKSFEETNRSVNFIKGIDHEIKLHINYCRKWKIPVKSLNQIKVEKANSSYTDYVLGVGKNGNNLDIFTCLSPCIIGYGEIGFRLSKIKNWKKSKYSSWIKMYSSKEYQKVANDNIRYLDILSQNYKNIKFNKLKERFKRSTILERNFWACFT
jgi:thiaminase/transcriptional activator TenA|tara:strand:+ start:1510 stop:2172 length:663 start_codon:yes stop_codon:yes gene_type:complete